MLFKVSQLAFYCSATLMYSLSALAGQTTRIVPISNDVNDYLYHSPSLSANSRYIAFLSDEPNLVAGDTIKHTMDVFVQDLLTHKIERVSGYSMNEKKNKKLNFYYSINISADGRHVAFVHGVEPTSPVNASPEYNVMVHDRLLHKTTLVSIHSRGAHSSTPHLSADGRYIAFRSNMSSKNQRYEDIFIYDQLTQKTEQINKSSSAINPSDPLSISADGRYVAFRDNNLFVYDRQSKKMEKINDFGNEAYLSANGRYIAFSVPGDVKEKGGFFVYDRLTHKTEQIDAISSDYLWYDVDISDDGRYISWSAQGSTQDNDMHVYVYDRLHHKTEQISHNGNKSTYNMSLDSHLNADGRYIVFVQYSGSISGGDAKGKSIFIRDRLLDTKHYADLQITTTKQSASVKPNKIGSYLYTITNNGKDTVPDVSLIHLVSGGSAVSFKPNQGKCSLSPAETVCHLGQLPAGKNITLNVTVKAQSKAINQQVTVSGAPVDTMPINNQISVTTLVQ